MPAPGLWAIDSELNGQPGRGFQIEVENGILLFTYYGYKADGTSTFYLASGPLVNNAFVGAMTEYKGGTVVGSAYRPGAPSSSPGNVVLNFSTGLKGTVTFPGEAAKAVSKFAFGYPATPEGLYGTYVFSTVLSTGSVLSDRYTLSRKAAGTVNGSGLALNTAGTFVCENITNPISALFGFIICVESTGSSLDDQYAFRMSGDRGAGTDTWNATSFFYPTHVLRVTTQNGVATGLNDGTLASLSKSAQAEGFADVDQHDAAFAKSHALPAGATTAVTPDEKQEMAVWASEARSILANQR